jgi:hypothetical protein
MSEEEKLQRAKTALEVFAAEILRLRIALEAALPDLHILDSRLQGETEAAGNKYYGLQSVRLVEAALSKAEGRG